MVAKIHENTILLLASALLLVLSSWGQARAAGPAEGELDEAQGRLIVDIELANGNRYEIWVDETGEDGELGFNVLESGLVGNPTVASIEDLDSDNLSELFHAIAPADMELPAELRAEFGEPSQGERGWLAERWQQEPAYGTSVVCADTWWVNQVCRPQPETNHRTWLNWTVSTSTTSWHWNTYNQTRYYVAMCNQGPSDVLQRISWRNEPGDAASQYERLAVPGTWWWWRRVRNDGIYNVHSYHFATSDTSTIDVCVARTPS